MTNLVTKPTTRVLVVDDDPSIRELLCAVLDDEGYATDSATDGLEGLDHAAASHPDVVLLDYAMPRCDGAAFAARYRLMPDHAPIILLSAAYPLGERCREVHADACLSKPFQIDALLAAVALHSHPHATTAAS